MRQRASRIVLLSVLVACARGGDPVAVSPDRRVFAQRSGTSLRFSDGAQFVLPESFVRYADSVGGNLLLTRRELEHARDGRGEWDAEYARVVNAALPFDSLTAHVGAERWSTGTKFNDVQARVYRGRFSPGWVRSQLRGAGEQTARELGRNVMARDSTLSGWERTTLEFDLFFWDYGSRARVDAFERPCGPRRAVLVFMYAPAIGGWGPAETIADEMRRSFRCGDETGIDAPPADGSW